MSINVADNFSYLGTKPLDGRTKYATLSAMKAQTEATLYDGCLAYVDEDSKMYQYKSSNDVDSTTGRWREYTSGTSYQAGTGITIDNNTLKSNYVFTSTLGNTTSEYPNNYIRISRVAGSNGLSTFLIGMQNQRYLIKANGDINNKAYPFMNLEVIRISGNGTSSNDSEILDCAYTFPQYSNNTMTIFLKVKAGGLQKFTLTELSLTPSLVGLALSASNLGNDNAYINDYGMTIGEYFTNIVNGQVSNGYQGLMTSVQQQKLSSPVTIDGTSWTTVENALGAIKHTITEIQVDDDFNDYTKNGIYRFDDSGTIYNAPRDSDAEGLLLVGGNDDDYIYQVYICGREGLYARYYLGSADTWSNWTSIPKDASLLQTKSITAVKVEGTNYSTVQTALNALATQSRETPTFHHNLVITSMGDIGTKGIGYREFHINETAKSNITCSAGAYTTVSVELGDYLMTLLPNRESGEWLEFTAKVANVYVKGYSVPFQRLSKMSTGSTWDIGVYMPFALNNEKPNVRIEGLFYVEPMD